MIMPYASSSYASNHRKGFDYEWYQCNCCPYGYHIDLDFVRYCESIGQSERTASINRRKDRRRQRQSMDVLLGLAPSTNIQSVSAYPNPIDERLIENSLQYTSTQRFQPSIVDATLNEAVVDFERTLQRSNKSNLPDVTAVSGVRRSPSVSFVSTASASTLTILPYDSVMPKEFDSLHLESNGLSPTALQTIREQMALSLKRMKQLEEQVKLIPALKTEIDRLEMEKNQLSQRLKTEQTVNLNNINRINNNVKFATETIKSTSNVDGSVPGKDLAIRSVPRKDVGVSCVALSRSIGVGHQSPNTRSVSTSMEYLNSNIPSPKVTLGTQTHCSSFLNKKDVNVQTNEIVKQQVSVGCLAVANVQSEGSQTSVDRSIGVSDGEIIEIPLLKHDVETETMSDFKINDGIDRSISLAVLSSSPQNNQPEQNAYASDRCTVGCQYEFQVNNKFTQHNIRATSKGCQSQTRVKHKATQLDIAQTSSKITDTSGLLTTTDVACNSEQEFTVRIHVGTQVQVGNDLPCYNCTTSKESVDQLRKDDPSLPLTPSRIPRLSERRKFEKPITCTKIPVVPSSISPASRLSSLDLPLSAISKSSNDSAVESLHHSPSQIYRQQDGVSYQVDDKTNLSSHRFESPTTNEERKKSAPSKEMQGAIKVLNDSLQKGHTKYIENQVKSALNIILKEWFKISSLVTADPHEVEDYLDCFEDISSDLLEYIVNMVDASGNTAMHYAVSHGNFDVVSILLDSKVCDINKQNKAGYTSVMLVSLAEVRSQTHANVVKRLFSLADVNIRAKQHGQTALMLAVSHGRLDMVQMLIDAGADINIQDEDGSTALMCAAEHGHIDIVKYFLNQPDCNSSIYDVDGSTALKIAMEAGHRHIGVLLYAHERNLSGGPVKAKKSKSASASPKAPASPLAARKSFRSLPNK